MKSLKPRAQLHTSIAHAMTQTVTSAAPRGTPALATAAAPAPPPDLPAAVIDWLAQLTLLYGVPFSYLVPDPRMLPTESLRFFYVDRNWLDRLIDGAMSVGTGATVDNVFNELFFEAVYKAVADQQAQLRATLRKRTVDVGTPSGGPLAGFLFRSVIVSTWPGLEVQGLDASQNPVPLLRMDRLSNNVLLVIFNGIPASVNIIEPSEGLHMGVVDTQTSGTVEVYLRYLTGNNVGQQIQQQPGQYLTAQTQYRTGAFRGVLDIGTLVSNIQKTMPAGAMPGDSLTPGGFAIQTIEAAGLQAFTAGANPCPIGGNS